MKLSELPEQDVVLAARAGDRQALDALVAGYLPLVYTVVGRAADSDLEVDDVVQETMVRVLAELPALRQVGSFRPWVVSIALNRLADARRQAGSRRVRRSALAPEQLDPADPASDFVALAILRDALTREQREVAQAARWLDLDFRDLLSLWWLEQAGQLSRAELVAAMDGRPAHVAVRVQRMRAQLDTSRSVVRALNADPACAELVRIGAGWDGVPGPLWRKRLARHVRGCAGCGAWSARLVPPERLLAAFPLMAVPVALAHRLAHPSITGWTTTGASGSAITGTGTGTGVGAGTGAGTGTGAAVGSAPAVTATGVATHAGAVSLLVGAGGKAVSAAVAAVLLVGGGTAGYVAVRQHSGSPAPSTSSVAATWAGSPAGSATGPAAGPTPSEVPKPAAGAAGSGSAPARPATSATAGPVTPSPVSVVVNNFSTAVPKIPAVRSGTELGPISQNSRVAGRDNGQSAAYGNRSVWIFDDTTLKNPWGFLSNSGAVTTDLHAADGITLTSGNPVTVRPGQTPVQLLPLTAPERAFEARHDKATGCTAASDQYCGARFGFWPGPVVADPDHGRVLVFYGKLCRLGGTGTPCSGPLGKGLGTGIAAINMRTGVVSRLTAVHGPVVRSVEGVDPTMFFGDGDGFSAASLVVNGTLYAYGNCSWGCKLARVPLAQVGDRSRWRFFAGGGSWSTGSAAGVHVIDPGSAGQSVFYDPALKAYLNVFMPYGTSTVKYQVGGSPYGPWSASRTALETAGAGGSNYAMFAHPEYAEKNGLVQYLSYFQPKSGAQRLVRLEFQKP